jgi:KDO2-lipid IV(A) lauroyltransferase
MLVLLKSTAFLLGHIPLDLTLVLAKLLGRLAYLLDRKRAGIAKENIRMALGDGLTKKEVAGIAKKVFENLSITFFEFMRQPWLKPSGLDGYVECVGMANLEKALSRGKGAIICTAHFGNWELLGAFLGLKGFPLDIVVREADHPVLDGFIQWVRMRSGNRIISKQGAMRRLIKSLSQNGIAGILLDQNVTHVEGVFVDFLGKEACTNKGPALLAASSGAAVLPTFILRTGKSHTVFIDAEIELMDSGDKARDATENTTRFSKAIEEMVKKHPEQWFWVHRRWKTRPPGENKR